MTRKQRIKELLNKEKRTSEEDKKLRGYQNDFILKSKVNPRLFDCNFEKVSKNKKYLGLDRRGNGKNK